MCFSYDCIRDFLEIIYFISSSFIPVLLLIITLKFSKSGNMIAQNTLRLQEIQFNLKPKFKFDYVLNDENIRIQESLFLSNKNDIYLEDCKVKSNIFLILEPYKTDLKPLRKSVMHYYFNQSGNLSIGGTVKFSPAPNEYNWGHYSKLYKDIAELKLPANLIIERYINITYVNEIGESKDDTFLVNEFGFEKVERIQINEDSNKISLFELKSEDLIKEFRELNNLNKEVG